MKIVSVCSARPNFVKLAAVHRALKDKKEIEHVIVHTGQHYDPLLSDVFFEQLHIPDPKFNLGIKGGEDREAMIAATADAMLPVLQEVKPDIVLVYGDVNGAVGAARAAKKLGLKVGHVEAGLRSKDMAMPEEHNRIEIDQIADKLFTSEKSAEKNIVEEGLKGDVYFVGNTMIDSLKSVLPFIETFSPEMEEKSKQFPGGRYAIATIHRPSNVDDPNVLRSVMNFLDEISEKCSIILPEHPRLKKALQTIGYVRTKNVLPVDPLAYVFFLSWMEHAAFIVTDSGGIQEEAVLFGKRCFTLRRNTERPSTLDSGSNVLIDPSKPEDRQQVLSYAQNPKPLDIKVPDLWDGNAGKRIVDILLAHAQR